jgi:molecular chaperone DnaK (HSP70)
MAKAVGIGTTNSVVAVMEGGEPTVIISDSTQLSKDEIDRMVKDGESHPAEDRRRREEVEVRNAADSMAYQVERQVQELGQNVPANEKARAEQLIREIGDRIKSPSLDIARLRQMTSELNRRPGRCHRRRIQGGLLEPADRGVSLWL